VFPGPSESHETTSVIGHFHNSRIKRDIHSGVPTTAMIEAAGSNVEVARYLSKHKGPSGSFAHEILEIAEAIVLALVAACTAWK
jgi:hypothetical protein